MLGDIGQLLALLGIGRKRPLNIDVLAGFDAGLDGFVMDVYSSGADYEINLAISVDAMPLLGGGCSLTLGSLARSRGSP